jgi:hypothetical protein
LPGSAIPPFPGSPVKFSGLIDLDCASDNLKMLPISDSMPLKLFFCALQQIEPSNNKNRKLLTFLMIFWLGYFYIISGYKSKASQPFSKLTFRNDIIFRFPDPLQMQD